MTIEEGDWKGRLKALGISRVRRRAAAPGPASGGGGRARETAPHVLSGRAGESAAARFLEERGARVLELNVRYPDGELDIVCETARALVFVEVKRRRDGARGTPAEAVTPRKRARVLRAARRWLAANPASAPREVRFDIVAIQDEPAGIEWIQGAFDAS